VVRPYSGAGLSLNIAFRAVFDIAYRSVGDNLEWDVAAPQRLGIYGIWNDYLNKGLPPTTNIHPDRIINSISELTKGNAAESLKANR
jgi:hypothetical protein